MQKENYLEDILYNLGFEEENGKIKNKLNFSGYKINNYFTEQIKMWKEGIKEKEDITKEISNFISFYFDGGDFGYFKNKYDNYSYRLEYKGEDTLFIWATKDSYYVKTSDENNVFKPDLGSLIDNDIEIVFEKKFDTDKPKNFIKITKNKENNKTYFINIYNLSLKKKGKKTRIEETKEYLIEEIKNKLNELLKEDFGIEDFGTKFIEQFNKDKQLDNFFNKWKKDYFIHKSIGKFLREELLNYIWDKYGNADINGYNNILKQIEKDKFNEFYKLLNNKVNDKEKTLELVDDFINVKLYKKDNIINKIKQITDKNGKYIIKDIIKENSILNNIIEKQKESFDNYKVKTDEFWEEFRKQAEDLIDIIEQIEEIKKTIWLQKRNVVKTDYVITLDKIYDKKKNKNFILDLINKKQIEEWKKLGFIGDDFKKEDIFNKENLKQEYRYLSIDTKFLDEIQKYKILSLFDDLEEELNGLLIKSENFQALNTLKEKYKGKIKCIYIDPPYNTGNDGFVYKDNFKHSSWLSMMENRLRLAREFLSDDGSIFVSIDDNEQDNLKKLMDKIFGGENLMKTLIWESGKPFGFKATTTIWPRTSEYVIHYSKNKNKVDYKPTYTDNISSSGKKILTGSIIKVDTDKIYSMDFIQGAKESTSKYGLNSFGSGQKPIKLIQKFIRASGAYDDNNSIILDFFSGSGTTQQAVIELNKEDGGNRKYIGIELGNYFDTIMKPRIQKVVYTSNWKDGKPQDNDGVSQIMKYQYLDQYEDIFLNNKIENYISKYFKNNSSNQVKKEDYTNFKEYIQNYKYNTMKDYLQSVIYDFGLKEKSYKVYNNCIILETDKYNFIKIFNKEKINDILNYIEPDKEYYLKDDDYKKLTEKIDKKPKNIYSISKLYFTI